ncbi:formyltransferase family protein [Glycocaulis abyssi]|uniref:Formyltransferase family protein n=1 Tax=Glycocaulis abyssi TaxID=1433403 RepID=A0ABV9NHD1_9PROT
MKPILLIAGYDKAPHAIAIAEQLRRLGTPPDLILIAYPLSLARISTVLRTRGLPAILRYAAGKGRTGSAGQSSPLRAYLRDAGLAEERSLKSWARRWNVRCASVRDINSPAAVRIVSQLGPSVAGYTGGGILRRPFLEAAGRHVLNAHSGPLPAIRGMNACEWSLLLGHPLAVTVHHIDEGIDTGPELERIAVQAHAGDKVDALRERCVVAGIDALTRHIHAAACGKAAVPCSSPGEPERQCFVLAPALREVLELRLPELISRQQEMVQQG